MARAIKLINAPVGLFDIDGVLVLKTEYSTQHEDGAITPDCYIVDSGEYFWGGVDSVEERNNLMVTPIDMPALSPPNEPLTCEELRKMNEEPVWIQNLEKPEESQWRLLYWDKGKYLVLQGISVRGYLLEEYGESWFAYRRPPEGEA